MGVMRIMLRSRTARVMRLFPATGISEIHMVVKTSIHKNDVKTMRI